MTTSEALPVTTTPQPVDPYALDPADVMKAPTHLRDRLKFLGPSMLMSAAVIGSGELITTTTMGAQAGFALLWLIVLSTGAKIWVQMEIAKITILSGEPGLQSFSHVPPRMGKGSWINWLWILLDFCKMLQRGGTIGGTVAALSLLWPIVGEPLSHESLVVWTVLTLIAVISLNLSNKYSLLEKVAFGMVVTFSLVTVLLALSLPLTPFGYGLSDLASGFSFTIPAGAVGLAIAVFGITGVGSDEITSYTYWCVEKGYARWTGLDDGTEERAQRAHGWIKVMQLDILVGWVITVMCTISFYIMGAAVLHPQNLVPSGNDVIVTLSHMYTDILGPWAMYLFLIGAVGTLGSTFVASTATAPRLWANNLAVLGVYQWQNLALRNRLIRIFTIVMPCIWAVTYLGLKSPVIMVMIGGFGSAFFLFAVIIAAWYLRIARTDKQFNRSVFLTGMLIVSSAVLLFVAVVSLLEQFGISLGG